jgi:hypothetical protein
MPVVVHMLCHAYVVSGPLLASTPLACVCAALLRKEHEHA